MADLKITELTALTTPNVADLFVIVDDLGGTATTKKITLANSLKDITIAGGLGGTTWTGTGKIATTVTTEQLRLNYDSTNYIKVTVADDGHTTFQTVDADGAEADINFVADGNVGIATAAPSEALHVTGAIKASTDLDVGNDVLLYDGAVVGITGNEVITWDAAGTINFTGCTVDIDGAFTATSVGSDTGFVAGTVAVALTIVNSPTGISFTDVGATGEHMIDVVDAYLGAFIETGTYQSSADGGIILHASNQRPVAFLFDDSGDTLGSGNYRAVLSRVYLAGSQAGQVAIRAIRGQLKVASTKNLTIATNEMNALNGVEGYIEMAGTHTVGANARVAAVHGLLEVNDNITLTAGGYMCGLFAELSQVNSKTVNGVGTAGLMIDRLDSDHATNQVAWTRGIVIQDSSCTTGIDIGTATTGIEFSGTVTEGVVFNSATFIAGSAGAISSRALTIGDRDTEFTIPFAGSDGVENFEPIQMVTNVTGTNPASVSKINMIYQQLTHDTDAMANLRLKCADFTITVNEACKDVYAYQGEIAFGAGTFTVGGEVATVGLVLNGGSGTITASGGWRVLNLTARGAGLPVNASGLYIQCESSCTLTDGIRIQTQATGTITNGILFGNTSGTSNTCPTNMIKVPAIGSGFVSAYTSEEAPTGKIQIQVGGATRYIAFWD